VKNQVKSRQKGERELNLNRRKFLGYFSALGLGSTLLPGALACSALDGREITAEMLATAARIAGLEFSNEELESIAHGLKSLLEQTFAAIKILMLTFKSKQNRDPSRGMKFPPHNRKMKKSSMPRCLRISSKQSKQGTMTAMKSKKFYKHIVNCWKPEDSQQRPHYINFLISSSSPVISHLMRENGIIPACT